ncbi:MAG: alpha/beta hydrolase [Acidimicrobiales bacterium]
MSELLVNTVGTTGEGSRLLVLIHGYGADEYDLAPLAPHIDPEGRFFTICPRGPHSVMGAGAGWYERNNDGSIDPAMFLASVEAIDAAVDKACAENGLDRSQAVFIGFSQGGAMTLASTLRSPGATRPAAIACLSGMLQEIDGLDYAFSEGESLPDILVHHGMLDPLVTIDRGHKIRDTLTANGIEHVYREYPMQHEISPQSVYDLRDWLAER